MNCILSYDFDNSGEIDVFDAVAALENLSGQSTVIYNTQCSNIPHNGIDLFKVFYLMEKIAGVHN